MRTVELLLVVLASVSIAPAGELPAKKVLTLDAAKGIAAEAEAFADKNGWNVVIAILDDGGHLIYLQREDGVQIGSIEVAIGKAKTSAYFRQDSKVFADRLSKGATGLVGLPGALPFEGGAPIVHEGQVIGAIGVSGATAAEDGQVARAGAAALAKVLSQ